MNFPIFLTFELHYSIPPLCSVEFPPEDPPVSDAAKMLHVEIPTNFGEKSFQDKFLQSIPKLATISFGISVTTESPLPPLPPPRAKK